MVTMLLHAEQLQFNFRDSTINIEAELSPQFQETLIVLENPKSVNNYQSLEFRK